MQKYPSRMRKRKKEEVMPKRENDRHAFVTLFRVRSRIELKIVARCGS
jgi:hypothetical protein